MCALVQLLGVGGTPCLHLVGHADLLFPVQEAAVEESQKYKEGKFILEKAKIMKVSCNA